MKILNNLTIENGWILSLIFLLVSYLPMVFSKSGRKRLIDFSWMNKRGKQLSFAVLLLFVVLLISPVFYRITYNLWLIFIGTFGFSIGILGTLTSYFNYFSSEQGKLITKGLYRISRNPMYVSTLIMISGMAALCGSYIMTVILILYFFIQHPVIIEEERFCKESFKEDFELYKEKTRRYL